MSEQKSAGQFYQTSFEFNEWVVEDSQTFHLTPAPIVEADQKSDKAAPFYLPAALTNRLAQPDAFASYGFAKDNPALNCFRRYIITYQPSLWNDYTVFRQWGRVGSERMLSRTEHFEDASPAQKRVFRLIRKRLRRGYQLSFAA